MVHAFLPPTLEGYHVATCGKLDRPGSVELEAGMRLCASCNWPLEVQLATVAEPDGCLYYRPEAPTDFGSDAVRLSTRPTSGAYQPVERLTELAAIGEPLEVDDGA